MICLDSEGELLQRGCCCRGDAGLAHLQCLVELAAHVQSKGSAAGWSRCGTCKAEFTGGMLHGLAGVWWARVQPLLARGHAAHELTLAEIDEFTLAASNLAGTLHEQRKPAEAEAIMRELLATQTRVLGGAHSSTLQSAGNLAITLNQQGKHAKAEALYRELLPTMKLVLGDENPTTLFITSNLGNTLGHQGKHAEAEALHREVLATQKRVLGDESIYTLRTACNLAIAGTLTVAEAEAKALYREVLAVQKRVLGDEHPDTFRTARNLASTLK